MKAVDLINLFVKKQISPRCELVVEGMNVTVIDVEPRRVWRELSEGGHIVYHDSKPKNIHAEEMVVGHLKLGPSKIDEPLSSVR